MPTETSVASLDDLQQRLDALNEAGLTPVLPGVDAWGVAFIATLVEHGDEARMGFISTDDMGRARCPDRSCEECGAERSDWAPAFPVSVLAEPLVVEQPEPEGGA